MPGVHRMALPPIGWYGSAMRTFKSILAGLGTFLLVSLGFTPLLGIVAGVIVGRRTRTALGTGYPAVRARWWIENFFITGFCCSMIWVIGLVITAGAAAVIGPAGAILVIAALVAVVFTGIYTWRESPAPAEPSPAAPAA